MKKQVAYMVDTGSYFEINKLEDLFIVPISIVATTNKDTKIYNDSLDINRQELEKMLDSKNISVSTSQPNLGLLTETIHSVLNDYEKIVFIPLSKHLSGFYLTLKNLANNEFKDRLIVLDSESVGIDGYWLVKEIQEKVKNNELTIDEQTLEQFAIQRKKKVCGVVIIKDLKQLIKGGRLKGVKAALAKTLKMKISVKFQGNLEFYSKDINLELAAIKSLKMIDSQINYSQNGIKNITIMDDLKDKEYSKQLLDKITKILKIENYDHSLLPGCIISHVGTDTFSILIESK